MGQAENGKEMHVETIKVETVADAKEGETNETDMEMSPEDVNTRQHQKSRFDIIVEQERERKREQKRKVEEKQKEEKRKGRREEKAG